ncbi:Two-component sensor histidine kinase, contains HisKA and HATPase domains [Kriegella aquimaris]|uniref:histidine kinase n=2 Tax=Kriegella aquimaris TaxID=192904 RepID=A0A1G9UF94_9FLAO|nr:Two-component sensor histidine kinase, contains HisKA and HATPase domains [Kriegella aquimaris]
MVGITNTYESRTEDKTRLLLKFNYVSSILSVLFAFLCIYFLNIHGPIPYVFFLYSIFNLLNSLVFKKHGNLTVMALTTTLLSLVSTFIITIYSGGINSPFIFILSIIVLAGYVSTRFFGKVYLYIVLMIIILIYVMGFFQLDFITNQIPSESQNIFSLASVLFGVYLLGNIFGRDLIKAHHKLYKSKSELENRIVEKEMLLREVHHRVKNNLQTISSLLNLQSKYSANEQVKELLGSCQTRVLSMAMIHEMLYMKDNLSKIDFKPYVQELVKYLMKSANKKNVNISVNIDIPDIMLGIDTAIPLGLLINEAVTNSLKYGYDKNDVGQIDIILKKQEDMGMYTLEISDDGVGFSHKLDFKKANSLGLKLIHNLARQLRSSIERDFSKKGTNYSISFQDKDKHFKPTT